MLWFDEAYSRFICCFELCSAKLCLRGLACTMFQISERDGRFKWQDERVTTRAHDDNRQFLLTVARVRREFLDRCAFMAPWG
jgi:hypothetical protein